MYSQLLLFPETSFVILTDCLYVCPFPVNTIVTLVGLFPAILLLSSHTFVTFTSFKNSVGISFVSSTVSVFSGVFKFIVPVTLFVTFALVTSKSLYTKLIFFVIFICFFPFVNISIPVMFSVHVIVLLASSYVPPSRLDLLESIAYGNVSTITTSASPIYVSTFAEYVILYGTAWSFSVTFSIVLFLSILLSSIVGSFIL